MRRPPIHRRVLTLLALAACSCACVRSVGARAMDGEASAPPVAAAMAVTFISTSSSAASDPPGTVSPPAENDRSGSSSQPPVTSSPPPFSLQLSASSTEFVDTLEIVEEPQAADAPHIVFESLTDKSVWNVNRWEDPLTQLFNLITNEKIDVPAGGARLAVQLNDSVGAVNVSFAKSNLWHYGPTLVLDDQALEGLTKVQNLEFSNFNVSFEGSKWLPTDAHLKTLRFEKATIQSFSLAADSTVARVELIGSTFDKFPTDLLELDTGLEALTIESTTFSQPLSLTASQLATLQALPSVTFSQNTFPAPNAADCASVVAYQDVSVCITTPTDAASTPVDGADTGDTSNASPAPAPAPAPSSTTTGLDGSLPSQSPLNVEGGSRTGSFLHTLIIILSVVGGIALVAGFVLVRRKRHQQDEPLMLTNQNDKFLGQDDDSLEGGGRARPSLSSHRTTTGGAGPLSEWDLGRNVISSEARLGPNGLWRASYRGEKVAALCVNVESWRDQTSDVDAIVSNCVALRHPYIVEFLGTSLAGTDEMWLVAEYMTKGSLRSVLFKKKLELTWDRVRRIGLDVASALAFVQSARGTSVRVAPSLSSRSILCDNDFNCKLDVFEFADASRNQSSPVHSFGQGEIASRAPEVLNDRNAGMLTSSEAAAAEVYALGVIFCELTHQRPVYSDILEERGNTLGEIFVAQEVAAGRLRPQPTDDTPEAFAQVIAACVAFDAAERPTLTEVVDWLTNMEEK